MISTVIILAICFHHTALYLLYVIILAICFHHTALYLLYAKLEEDHGLARHAMNIYDRATRAVLPEEQYEVCRTLISHQSAYLQSSRYCPDY